MPKQNTGQAELSSFQTVFEKPLKERDRLGRYPFAKSIARLIQEYNKEESITIGIEGPWGFGKSFVIDSIEEEIENYNTDKEKPIFWHKFNPWHFNNTENLACNFLRTLAIFLEEKIRKKEHFIVRIFKKAIAFLLFKDTTIRFAIFFLTLIGIDILFLHSSFLLSFLPSAYNTISAGLSFYGILPLSISLLWSWIAKPIKKLDHFLAIRLSTSLQTYAEKLEDYKKETLSMSLQDIKEEIHTILSQDSLPFEKLIIAIEDLDRLHPDEIRSVMQLMRMVADFPKIIYLIGYDREHVVSALNSFSNINVQNGGTSLYGEGYLQKTIQAAYTLPPPKEGLIAELTFYKFYESFFSVYGNDYTKTSYWLNTQKIISGLIGTLRDSDLILNRALQMVNMLSNKSNPADIIACAYLMEFQKDVWNFLWINREKILSRGEYFLYNYNLVDINPSGFSSKQPPKEGFINDQIKGNEIIKRKIVDLLIHIFPSFINEHYTTTANDRKTCRVGIYEFFESYFRYEQTPVSTAPDLAQELVSAKNNTEREIAIRKLKMFDKSLIAHTVQALIDTHENTPLTWERKGLPILKILAQHFDTEISIIKLATVLLNAQNKKTRYTKFQDLLRGWFDAHCYYLPIRFLAEMLFRDGVIETAGTYKPGVRDLEIDFSSHGDSLKAFFHDKTRYWEQEHEKKELLEHKYLKEIMRMSIAILPEETKRKISNLCQETNSFFLLLKSITFPRLGYETGKGETMSHFLDIAELKEILDLDIKSLEEKLEHMKKHGSYTINKYPEVMEAIDNTISELN